jgi:hypothetical protein
MRSTPVAHTPPAVIEHTFALWTWLDARVVAFPANARPLLGRSLHDAAVDLLDRLLRVAYLPREAPERSAELRVANQRVALLRYLLRGALERHYLSRDQHAYAAERLDAIGRMVGAWARAGGP